MLKNEIESLAAETLAVGSIVAMVFYRLGRTSPEIAEAIGAGFDDAASFIEQRAMKGTPLMPQYVVGSSQNRRAD